MGSSSRKGWAGKVLGNVPSYSHETSLRFKVTSLRRVENVILTRHSSVSIFSFSAHLYDPKSMWEATYKWE